MPLGELVGDLPGLSRLKGRYLNGTVVLGVVLVDEVLVVSLRSLEVKGRMLPPEVVSELRSQNLFDRASEHSELQRLKRHIDSIRIEDGKLTIRPRAKR